MAAGCALEAVAKSVPAWGSGSGSGSGSASASGSGSASASGSGSAGAVISGAGGTASGAPSLTFDTFSVDTVVDQGAELLASSGAEYDVDTAGMDAQQRLRAQHRNLRARLGLRDYDAGTGLHEMVGDEDLAQAKDASPSGRKRTAADMIGSSGSGGDGQLTVREKNRAKRLASRAKRNGSSADAASAGVAVGGAAGSAAAAAADDDDDDDQSGRGDDPWPFFSLCARVRQDILHPSWEVRHGAAIGLRALVRQHAQSLGVASKDKPSAQAAQNRSYSEDLAVRICCVIALDHFGDYAAESVVAPVRETCAQVLGALAVNLEPCALRSLLSVLTRMQVRDEWHVRHASFLALKYTVALQVENVAQLAPELVPVIVTGLNDADDEVRAAAAETLVPLCGVLLKRTDEILQQCMKSASETCWQMLLDDGSNVTTMAMMKLAAALNFGNSLEMKVEASSFCVRAKRMLVFLSHGSVEVRTTAIQMLFALVKSAVANPKLCAPEFSNQVLCKVFHTLLCETVDDVMQSIVGVWQSLLDVLPCDHLIAAMGRTHTWIKLIATADGRSSCPRVVAEAFAGCDGDATLDTVSMYSDASLASRCRLRCCRALAGLVSKWPSDTAVGMLGACVSNFAGSCSAWERQCCALLLAHCDVCLDQNNMSPAQTQRLKLEQICSTACVDLECGKCYAELQPLHDTLERQVDGLKKALKRAAGAAGSTSKLQGDLAGSGPDIIESALQICTVVFDKHFALLNQDTHCDLVRLLLQLRETTAATIGQYSQERARIDAAVMSSGAAALISTGMIPTKLNPVIKALMNAVKREQSSELHIFAAETLVKMVQWCGDNGKSKVSNRIVHNCCALLCDTSSVVQSQCEVEGRDEDEIDDEAARQHACRGATVVLAQLCVVYGESLFRQIPALHQAASAAVLHVHKAGTTPGEQEVFEAAKALRVCGALSNHIVEGEALSSIIALVPSVLCCIAYGESKMLTAACRCLASIAAKRAGKAQVMDALLVEATSMLGDSVRLSARMGAVYALHEIMSVLNVDIVPYLTQLVVPVMGAMSDSNGTVRRIATLCFCAMVKLMPLEAGMPAPAGLTTTMLAARETQKQFIAQLLGDRPPLPYAIPVRLNIPLRQYQQEGVNWLAFLRSFQLHGILCDEMGLGKTLTALSIIAGDSHDRRQVHLKTKSSASVPLPSLVVCPSTLVGHWYDEVLKHCDDRLNAVQYAGTPRQREQLRALLPAADVVIISYETVRADIDFLASCCCFNYCVLDEGHIIRNSKAKVTQAIKRIESNHRLILSGTPIQNNVLELWSMFDFLMPGFLGTERDFNKRFSRPIESGKSRKNKKVKVDTSILAMEALHRQVLPFILGRTKDQVLRDLPPKIIQDIMCDISPLQKRLYDQFEKSSVCSDCIDTLAAAKPKTGGAGNVLQSLQYMRKISNHPALVLTESHPLHNSITSELHGSGSSLHDLQHAPKLIVLKQLLADCGIGSDEEVGLEQLKLQQQQHRVLLFCQLKSLLSIIERDLFAKIPGISYLRLDGDVAPADRQGVVRRFNTDPTIDVLLLTTKVGGLGLNLTGADTVIFMEHDWNPAADLQAMDRAHRLGQKKVVNVYRLISRGTLEEKIMNLQAFKRQVAKTVVSTDNSSMITMDTESIVTLFGGSTVSTAALGGGAAGSANPAAGSAGAAPTLASGLQELWSESQYTEEYSLDDFCTKFRS